MTFTTGNDVEDFRGPVPIFAQPRLVLFPGTSRVVAVTGEPLRRMVADALRADGLIAVARDAKQEQVAGHLVSLARIATPSFLAPAANHMHIQGLCRARVVSLRRIENVYDRATIEICPDNYTTTPVIDRRHRCDELLALFRELFPHVERNDLFQLWGGGECPLGVLCDLIADLLPIEPRFKHPLLAESDVDLRSDLLLDQLRELTRGRRYAAVEQSAIPRFSAN